MMVKEQPGGKGAFPSFILHSSLVKNVASMYPLALFYSLLAKIAKICKLSRNFPGNFQGLLSQLLLDL
jgi:hypothetical protein